MTLSIILCCSVARGQLNPDLKESTNPEPIALCIGISDRLARLRALSTQASPENSAARMWLHQDILEEVTAGSMQLDATIAQIDFEISSVNALRSSLADARDRAVNRLNLAGLVAGGGLGTVSSGLQLSQAQARNSTLIGISAGVLSSAFALAGIRAQHGRSKVLTANSNMLAELFGREPLPGSRYPDGIAMFLDQVPSGAEDSQTRGEHLIAAWVAEQRIEPLSTATGRQAVDRITSRPSQPIRQSIEDLDNRAAMLADFRATISLMKQDLAGLLRSLPKAEAGEPYKEMR